MYTLGEGTICDYEKAIEWEMKATKLGDVTAPNNLGISYCMKGDLIKAKYYFEYPLNLGNIEAALELAKSYSISDLEKTKCYISLVLTSMNVFEDSKEEAFSLLKN